MPEQKPQPQQTQQPQQQEQAQKGLFPFKVKKFLSGVASAGQAVLREAQDLQQHQHHAHRKPPIAVSPASKPKDPSVEISTVVTDSKKQHKNGSLSTPPMSPPLNRHLVSISPEFAVDMTKGVIERPIMHFSDSDWEILSTGEKASNCSGVVLVSGPRAGSVRSITSLDHDSSNRTTLSVPFKIQRTNSSSTIDSQDNVLGPSGKGILGVDYVEHVCLPTDTLQGICIAYKVSASQLRRANHFSGTLHSAPKKLLIPLSKQALRTGYIRVQSTDTKEYKLHYFQAEFPDITATEAKGYLELADWELKDALKSAKEDREWESGDEVDYTAGGDQIKRLRSGQIGIKVGFKGKFPTFNLTGTGHSSSSKLKGADDKTVVHSRPPAIATKSVLAEDLYNAAPEHESYGFELKVLPKRSQSRD
jgi:LysM repeat protein